MAETLLHLIGLRAESTPGLVKWFFKSCKSKNKNSRSGVRWRNHFTDQRKLAPIFWNIHYSLLSFPPWCSEERTRIVGTRPGKVVMFSKALSASRRHSNSYLAQILALTSRN